MRRKIVVALVLLNAIIGAALFAAPAATQIIPLGIRHCCKYDAQLPYCCEWCCWFTLNCYGDDDCN